MIWIPETRWRRRDISGLPYAEAGDAALRLFCWPRLSERRPPNYTVLAERARFHLRKAEWHVLPTPYGDVRVYVFAPDNAGNGAEPRTVLVLHGWTGEASFMTALAEPIRRAGYRVVLFDMPAHGFSSGRSTNLVECAHATRMVGEAFGPVHAVVAHSFGGMAALLAMEGGCPMPRPLPVERLVLVASPNRLSEVTGHFAGHWHLSDAARRAYERRLERIGKRPLSHYTVVELLRTVGCRTLVVHDRKDDDVPYAAAEEIIAGVPGTELLTFDGFGHSNILFAPPVMRAVAVWLRKEGYSSYGNSAAAG